MAREMSRLVIVNMHKAYSWHCKNIAIDANKSRWDEFTEWLAQTYGILADDKESKKSWVIKDEKKYLLFQIRWASNGEEDGED